MRMQVNHYKNKIAPEARFDIFYNYFMAGAAGFEPTTPGFGDQCSTGLSYTPMCANVTSIPLVAVYY